MNKQRYAVILLLILSFSHRIVAEETYPEFNREYWENEQTLAEGKMKRGVGLGVAGVVLIWPTVVLISKAKENPQKYAPLSVLLGTASIGAMGHGFGSVGYGKKQKETAQNWIKAYDTNPGSVDLAKQQEEYLSDQQKGELKLTIFGAYSATTATFLLTTGIINSARSDDAVASSDIRVWPYYAAGGLLLTTGVRTIVKSRRRDSDLEPLQVSSGSSSRSQFVPTIGFNQRGTIVVGAFFCRSF